MLTWALAQGGTKMSSPMVKTALQLLLIQHGCTATANMGFPTGHPARYNPGEWGKHCAALPEKQSWRLLPAAFLPRASLHACCLHCRGTGQACQRASLGLRNKTLPINQHWFARQYCWVHSHCHHRLVMPTNVTSTSHR